MPQRAMHLPDSTRFGLSPDSRPWDALLLQVVDGTLAGSVLLVPFLMGGRQALGHLVLVGLAVAAALAGTARCCLRRTDSQSVHGKVDGLKIRPTALLLLGGIALVALQIAPLPLPVLRQLAPHNAEILPLWNTISLTPAATRDGLVVLLAYVLLFLAAVHRVRGVADVERLLRWLALAAVLMALLGLAQLLAGNGKFYWFYEHPFSSAGDAAKGAFANRNHFAQFLALGIGPLVWWFQDVRRRGRDIGNLSPDRPAYVPLLLRSSGTRDDLPRYLSVLALAVVLFAGLLSLSRGGITVMVVAAAIAGAICFRASSAGRSLILGAAAAALLIGGSLTIFGGQIVGRRLETFPQERSSGSIRPPDAARSGPRSPRPSPTNGCWAAAWEAMPPSIPCTWMGHWIPPSSSPMPRTATCRWRWRPASAG